MSVTLHAIERAKERYGLTLTREDLKAILRDIDAGRAVVKARTTDSVAYMLPYKDVVVMPVVMISSGLIVTFLGMGHYRNCLRHAGKQSKQHLWEKRQYKRRKHPTPAEMEMA